MPSVAGYRLTTSNAGHASVLANANDVRIKDSNFSITTNINTDIKSTLEVLYQRVAPNAILNHGGRADDAKCLPGTREEVISLIEKWGDAAESDRILWLSGPAGGGKTAIMKTITERAAKRDVHTVNFFFFRGDSSRQSVQPVVPTLLYQIFEYYPHSMDAIAEIISTRPRILDGSITQQCELISALSPIIRQSSPTGTPVILFIDGLDECDVDAERSQSDILRALEGLLMEDDSPFRLLVASRPEARIKMAFNQLSLRAQTIFLDGQYQPEKDIQRFVVAEFERIKSCHPSAHLLPPNWPSSSDVEAIVTKSSGQFIFAATVMRYIAHASTVPSLSLERVRGIVATVNNSPFMHLDTIYMFILSRVDDRDAVLAMFSLEIARHDSLMQWLCEYNPRYTLTLVASCVSELSAIVKLTASGSLAFYHASLPDFLVDKARSGEYWIDVDAFIAKMLGKIWNKPSIGQQGNYLQYDLLRKLATPTTEITHMLLTSPLQDWVQWTGSNIELPGVAFVEQIQRLYYKQDEDTYRNIILQCTPQWAQLLAHHANLMNYSSLSGMKLRFGEYLGYLSKGGAAKWASTVGESKIVQYDLITILGVSAKSLEDLPDGLGAAYLKGQWASRIRNTKVTRNVTTAAVGKGASESGVGGSPALRHNRMPSTARASMATPSRALHGQPPQPGSTRKERTEPPQAASQSARTINPRGVSGSRNVAPPKAFGVAEKQMAPSGSGILGMGTAQTAGRAQGMSQRQKDDGKKSTGDKDGSIVSRTAVIKGSTTSNPALRAISKSQSLMPPSRSPLPVNARKNATVDSASGGVTPGSGDKSATRRTARELKNIAPPRVSVNHDGGGEKTMAAESGKRLMGASVRLTLGGIRGKKQDIVSERQATVTKGSTSASPAPRSSSKSRSPLPPSRLTPSLQVNVRQKGATLKPGAGPVWRG